jgi:WD40 repeat protein
MCFSSDGKTLVAGGGQERAKPGIVEFWDVASADRIGSLEHPGLVVRVAVTDDRKFLAVAGADGQLKLYDWKTKKETYPIQGHRPMAFSVDGKSLVATWGFHKPEIRVWDLRTGEIKLSFPLGYVQAPASLAVSPDGKIIATGGSDQTIITLWNAETGKEIRRITDSKVPIKSLAFSPDGKSLASAGWTVEYVRGGRQE